MSNDWYKQQQEAIKAEQADKTREEIMEEMKSKSEYAFDFDNPPQVDHIWIDRGLKMSCENAGHPMHQAWKRSLTQGLKPM